MIRELIAETIKKLRGSATDEEKIKILSNCNRISNNHPVFMLIKYALDKTITFSLPEKIELLHGSNIRKGISSDRADNDLLNATKDLWVFLNRHDKEKYHAAYCLDPEEKGISPSEESRRREVFQKKMLHYQFLLESLGKDEYEILEFDVRQRRMVEYLSLEVVAAVQPDLISKMNEYKMDGSRKAKKESIREKTDFIETKESIENVKIFGKEKQNLEDEKRYFELLDNVLFEVPEPLTGSYWINDKEKKKYESWLKKMPNSKLKRADYLYKKEHLGK